MVFNGLACQPSKLMVSVRVRLSAPNFILWGYITDEALTLLGILTNVLENSNAMEGVIIQEDASFDLEETLNIIGDVKRLENLFALMTNEYTREELNVLITTVNCLNSLVGVSG